VILETILTTRDGSGRLNSAPMGVDWGEDRLVVRPYRSTRTYRNLAATGTGVVNVTDDALAFTRALLGLPLATSHPSGAIEGAVLAAACHWRELEVTRIDSSKARAVVTARVVGAGRQRDFLGFSRAAHAVVEASILASRARRLPREDLLSELARLRPLVEKTGGPRELEAMDLLDRHIAERLA
jgi:hypothetical protein